MGKTITKTVTQALMCRLTEAELEEESRKLTDFLLEKATLEVEKSSRNKYYTERIKGVDGRIEKQIPVVRDREIEREVECLVEYNVPEKGLKRITRLDTGEVVEKSEMSSDECQDLFLNAEDQNEAPAAPLGLPAPEEDGGIIDAEEVVEEVVHVDKETAETVTIVLKPNQLYNVSGKLVRAVVVKPHDCGQCVFDEDMDSCKCFSCDKTVFRPPYEGSTFDNEESSDACEESSPRVCSKCGLALKKLYHVDNEKLMCEHCMENTASAKRAAQFLAEGHKEFGFRPYFGYGCREEFADASCFRFRALHEEGGPQWGMNHYKVGDYRVEGTPAHDYMKFLKEIGGVEG